MAHHAVPMRSSALAHLSGLQVLWIITALFALQPLSTDLYLPSLPGIARGFDTSVATVQLTLSLFMAVFGVSLLVIGPLSDRLGRRPVLLWGLGLYVMASVLCMLAPSIEILLLGRMLQAIGTCCAMVGGRAMVRDLYAPHDGARILASAGMLMATVPLAGPILGGWLEATLGWRAAFGVHALFTLVVLIACLRTLNETSDHLDPSATRLGPLWQSLREIGRHPTFRAYALTTSFSYGGLFAFISGSSFVFIRVLDIAPQTYGLLFAAVICGYLTGATLCRRLLVRLGVQGTLYRAAALSSLAGLLLLGLALAGVIHPAAIVVPMFFYMIAHGMVTPCAQAGAVAWFPQRAGTATALMGMMQMLLASAVGLMIGITFNDTVFPLVITVFAGSMGVLASVVLGVYPHGHLPNSH